nr:LLM class flavin-dependent oxidoreductase [Burkholderia gladioli]
MHALWAGTGPLDHQGAWFRTEHARLAEMPVPRPPLYWMAADPADNLSAAPFCDGLIAVARPDPAVFEALARVNAARAAPAFGARSFPLRPHRGRRAARGPSSGTPILISLDFAWFLPTNGDGPHLANSGPPRPPTYLRDFRPPTPDDLRGVAREAEAAGFDSLLVPTATGFKDPWLVAAQLTRATRRIAFIVTFRPGLETPERIAAQAATLQRLGGGRLRLFAANGSSAYEQRALGEFLDHDARYQRSSECLRVLRRMWLGAGHSVAGSHYTLSPAQAGEPLVAPPALYLGGASGTAELVAAGQADTYLLGRAARHVACPRRAAARAGRHAQVPRTRRPARARGRARQRTRRLGARRRTAARRLGRRLHESAARARRL